MASDAKGVRAFWRGHILLQTGSRGHCNNHKLRKELYVFPVFSRRPSIFSSRLRSVSRLLPRDLSPIFRHPESGFARGREARVRRQPATPSRNSMFVEFAAQYRIDIVSCPGCEAAALHGDNVLGHVRLSFGHSLRSSDPDPTIPQGGVESVIVPTSTLAPH